MGGSVLGNNGTVVGSTNSGTGTMTSSKAAEAAAAHAGGGTPGSSKKSIASGGLAYVTLADGSVVPAASSQGVPLYAAGDEYAKLNQMSTKQRADIQREMYKLGLYGTSFTPVYGYISPTGEDYSALQKVLIGGAQVGLGDIDSIFARVKKDPAIKQLIVGNVGGKSPSVTDAATAAAKLNTYYMDMFNEKPSKAEVTAYTTQLNAAERASKGAIGAQQAEDILMGIASSKVNKTIAAATSGDVKAQAVLDAGQLGKTVRNIRNAYADNGLPIDDNTVYKKAVAAIRSNTAYDNVVQGINMSAKAVWGPQISTFLDQGQTVKDGLLSHISIKASALGVPASSIKISDMTDALKPDGTLKNPTEYKSTVFGSDAYKQSDNFANQKMNDTMAVLRNFGIG